MRYSYRYRCFPVGPAGTLRTARLLSTFCIICTVIRCRTGRQCPKRFFVYQSNGLSAKRKSEAVHAESVPSRLASLGLVATAWLLVRPAEPQARRPAPKFAVEIPNREGPPDYITLEGGNDQYTLLTGGPLRPMGTRERSGNKPFALKLDYKVEGDLVRITVLYGDFDIDNATLEFLHGVPHESAGSYSAKPAKVALFIPAPTSGWKPIFRHTRVLFFECSRLKGVRGLQEGDTIFGPIISRYDAVGPCYRKDLWSSNRLSVYPLRIHSE